MFHADTTRFVPPRRDLTDLERDEIVRQTLKEIETRINALEVNKTYLMAFKVVRKIIHEMKP